MIKRPMKGVQVDEVDFDRIRFPIFGSSKIDGFRCLLGDYPLTSRLSPFPNKHFHREASRLTSILLDGEVTVGDRRAKGVLQKTSSGLTSREGNPDWHLWVFDVPLINEPFRDRVSYLQEYVKGLHPRIHFLKQRVIANVSQLEKFIESRLALGYEGVILRSPDGFYKEGKSTLNQQWMLKIKPFEDAEGFIVDYYEEMENTNEAKREVTGKLKRSSAKAGLVAKGQLGGFVLRDTKTQVEVRVGGGFTLPQRKLFWRHREELKGKLVKYKKQSSGEKDKPRHPNFVEFLDFRPHWDMTD